jgi:hypothetical protein
MDNTPSSFYLHNMSEETLDPNKTYVYDGVEVVLTGRKAKKPSNVANRMLVLYEVEPKDKESIQWKKWVSTRDIFTIE